MHIYRWDLDRTYLDTDIHSVAGMLRSALESAADKRNITGADALLRALVRQDPNAKVSILSGSPTQMRDVLSEKLARDGIPFDSLVLKDNLRNLRRGRFRALRAQVGYKLPALLAQRIGELPGSTESLFGDDAEVDAAIYCLYAECCAGRIDSAQLTRILRAGGAYDDQLDHALRSFARLRTEEAVVEIFIRVDRGIPLRLFERLGPLVVVVFSWFQAALCLAERGRVSPQGVLAVAARTTERVGTSGLAALAQDAVRRRIVSSEFLRDELLRRPDFSALRPELERALDWLGPVPAPAPIEARTDVEGFLEQIAAWE